MKTRSTGKSAAANDGEQAEIDHRNQQVIARLRDYQQRHGLSNSTRDQETMAKRLGTSQTYLYRYLENDFRGRLDSFEQKMSAALDAETLRIEGNNELIDTDFVVKSVHNFLRLVKQHGFIGVGHGDAGKGKTCAARLFATKDPTAIYMHVNVWTGGRYALTREIARAASIKPVKGQTLDEALLAKLAGSDRLLILDNAHRVTEAARRWIADFWEATRLPIALLGNPEIERQFQRNDQHGSRVGLHRDITGALKKSEAATAAHLIRLHFPEAEGDAAILQQASAVLQGFGSCRALAMRAKLAHNMLTSGRMTDAAKAFEAASTQLITSAA